MRWTKPKDRDIKVKRKFALFPICLDREVRWLEWVTIEYVYREWEDDWYARRFIDNEIHEKINLIK